MLALNTVFFAVSIPKAQVPLHSIKVLRYVNFKLRLFKTLIFQVRYEGTEIAPEDIWSNNDNFILELNFGGFIPGHSFHNNLLIMDIFSYDYNHAKTHH